MKRIIEIPEELYSNTVIDNCSLGEVRTLLGIVAESTPFDSVIEDIKAKCDDINEVATGLNYVQCRTIQDSLADIMSVLHKHISGKEN